MMGNAPERIWATSDWKRIDHGKWWDCNPRGDAEEYVRADLAPAPSWQPISTAPRDGSEILVAVGKNYTDGVIVAFWSEHYEAWNDWELDIWNPTHWMPLPAPPEAS